jgi:gluconate 2-dehydrogenase gamma chain
MAEVKLPRRDFLKAAGAAGATGAAMATGLTACSPETKTSAAAAASGPETWMVLTPQEVAFFSAASDTIIPKDELSPSGTECGVPAFVDRQRQRLGRRRQMYRAGLPEGTGAGLSACPDAASILRRRRPSGQ